MMVFCCLLISYEEETFYYPDKKEKKGAADAEESLLKDKECAPEESEHCVLPDMILRFFDRISSCMTLLVFCLFNLMMVMTTLYFHTVIEKVLGVAIGVCSYNLITFRYSWKCCGIKQA